MEIPTKQKRLLQRSIALTLTCGVLLAGSAAYAATTKTVNWATDTEVVIQADETVAVNSMFTEDPDGKNIAAESVILSGGSLTLSNGGRLIGLAQDLDFSMTGGALTLTSGDTVNQITSIDAATVKLSGGTVKMTGKDGNKWEKAAYIGGYGGLTVSDNAAIEMGTNSELFIGKASEGLSDYKLNLSGGTVKLLGTATADGYGGNAAHIWANSGGANNQNQLLLSGADLIVGDGSAANYGVISSHDIAMSAGSLTVKNNAHLLLQPTVEAKGDASAIVQTTSDRKGKLTMSGGAFTVDKGGSVDIGRNFTILQTGGKTTIDGSMITTDNMNEYIIESGTLVLGSGDTAYTSQNAAALHASTLTIKGGDITVGNAQNSVWSEATSLGGYGDITIVSGGNITLNNSAVLWGGVQGRLANGDSGALNISGGTITMNGADGQDSVIFVASTPKDENTHGHVALNISGDAKIDVAKNGYIVSRETNLSSGTIDVKENGSLTVAGVIAKRNGSNEAVTADAGLTYANSTTGTYTQGGAFNLTGGAINVGAGATLDFASGKVDVTMTGGAFNATGSKVVNFKGLTYQGGTWGLGNAVNVVAENTSASQTASVNAEKFVVNHALELDTLNAANTVKVDGGGSLTVKHLNQTAGKLTVGGTSAGALKVTDSLKNIAYTSDTAGVKLDNLGTLEVGYDKVLDSNYALKSGVNKLSVLTGSTLKLTDWAADAKLTKANIDTIKTALGDNFKGVLDLGNAQIDVTITDEGTVAYDDVKGISSDKLKDVTATTDKATAVSGSGVNGGFKDIVVDGATAGTDTVKADGTLKLAGSSDASNALVKNGSGAALDLAVSDNAAVTLGDEGKANKGKVGDVTLGSSGAATLNAVGASGAAFETGEITKGSGTATITVDGATLNATSVGTGTAAIDTVNLNGTAALKATGDVNVGTLSGDGGSLSGANVKITTSANLTNGEIVATTGDIDATGKNLVAEGSALKAEKGEIKAANITANAVTAEKLTATGDVAISEGTLQLGTDDSTVGGALNLTDTNAEIKQKLTVTSAATIDGGTLQTAAGGELAFVANATLKGGAEVNVDKLTGASGQTIQVGSDVSGEGGATLQATTLSLNGGKLIVDPAWNENSSVAAIVTINDDPSKTDIVINGDVGVGQNAMLTIGTKDETWLKEQIALVASEGKLTQGGIDSALGLTKHIEIGAGKSLIVDGTKDSAALSGAFSANAISFGAKSLLVVDAAAFDATKGAISLASTGTATVADGAKLRITNAKAGEDYKVLGTNITATLTGQGWDGDNLSTNSSLVKLAKSATNGTFTATPEDAKNVYKTLTPSLQNTLDTMIKDKVNDTESADSAKVGAKFLSRATAEKGSYLDGNVRLAETTIEGAARMAALGGVPQMTMTALDASRNAIDARTSFASADQGRLTLLNDNAEESGGALWMMPIYQKVKTDDLDAGHYGYDVDGHLTGAAFGYDYTNSGTNRTGLTFSFGSGSADSTGVAYTDNDLDYWGLGLYSSWQHDNFNLVADLSYAKTKSDLTQSLSSAMDMGQLKADDVSGKALSFGLRGEYKYQNGDAEIIPHFGIRYTKLDTDSYSAYSTKDRAAILHAGDSSQKIWTFPIGVTFTKTIEQKSGWTCKPVFDLSLIPASGDLDADSVVRFTGVSSNALVSTEVMGDFSYKGTLGVEFGKDNLSYGIGYSIQASSEMTNHTVYGMVRYAF